MKNDHQKQMIYISKVLLLFLINIVYNKIIPYPLWVEGQGKAFCKKQTIPSYPALSLKQNSCPIISVNIPIIRLAPDHRSYQTIQMPSILERGGFSRATVETLKKIAKALDARLIIKLQTK